MSNPFTSSQADPIEESGLTLRTLQSMEELSACVALQKETWGEHFSEVVPPTILRITAKMGGIVVGAFDENDVLLAFVFGISGLHNGTLCHWSHMLAVRTDARNRGIGRQLKLRQRTLLQGAGVETMMWAFDPLEARNAHLNLNRLGARITEYVPDLYGASTSSLHQLGTDRFVVEWDLTQADPLPTGVSTPATALIPEGTPFLGLDAACRLPKRSSVAIQIPADISSLQTSDFQVARAWRSATRHAFTHYLANNYFVTAFIPGNDVSAYLVTKNPT